MTSRNSEGERGRKSKKKKLPSRRPKLFKSPFELLKCIIYVSYKIYRKTRPFIIMNQQIGLDTQTLPRSTAIRFRLWRPIWESGKFAHSYKMHIYDVLICQNGFKSKSSKYFASNLLDGRYRWMPALEQYNNCWTKCYFPKSKRIDAEYELKIIGRDRPCNTHVSTFSLCIIMAHF